MGVKAQRRHQNSGKKERMREGGMKEGKKTFLSLDLSVSEMGAIVHYNSSSILWHCLPLGLE